MESGTSVTSEMQTLETYQNQTAGHLVLHVL